METKKIEVAEEVFAENDRIAAASNKLLTGKKVFTVNVMGAPGAGKTSVIIRLAAEMKNRKIYVIEGDIESDLDTRTLSGLGIETVQINTHGACHLDAPILRHALEELRLETPGLLFIENVGNLVCPAEFEIGEHIKMLVCSAAEGSDKPYKYPLAFEKAGMIILNKCDLKPYVDFDDEFFYQGVRALNKTAPVFEMTAKTGSGAAAAARWLEEISTRL